MLTFVLWDAVHQEAGQTVGVDTADHLPTPPDGWDWRPIDGPITNTLAMVDGQIAEIAQPLPADVALTVAKADKWTAALAHRNERQTGGCVTPLGRVDTDTDSQRLINGAVSAATAAIITSQTFPPTKWTMADNAEVVHTGPAIIAMGLAVAQYIDRCQQASIAIRTQINAASTVQAVAAIDVTAGYPAN